MKDNEIIKKLEKAENRISELEKEILEIKKPSLKSYIEHIGKRTIVVSLLFAVFWFQLLLLLEQYRSRTHSLMALSLMLIK